MIIDWDAQVQALVDLGYTLTDAEAAVAWARRYMDQDDPQWLPVADQLDDTPEATASADAALTWDAPNEYQRILDARSESG